MPLAWRAWALLALATLAGCNEAGDDVPRCTPGLQAACPCPGGADSVQICNEDGTFGACGCPPGADAGEPDAEPPAGCTRLGQGRPRFGVVLPLTGSLAAYGPGMVRGIELALEARAPLAALVCDSGSDPATAADAIRACAGAGLPAVIGPAASFVAVDAFEAAARPTGTLLLSPSATAPALTTLADDDLFWRTAPSDARQATAMARLLAAEALADPVVLVTREDPFGAGLADAFSAAYCPGGCGEDRLIRAGFFGDPAPAAERLAAVGPVGAVVLLIFPGDLDPIRAALPGDPPLWLPDALRTPEVGRALSRARRAQVHGVMPALPTGPAWNAFAAAHQARYGEPPAPFAAHAWDAAHALALAAGARGEDVAAALRSGAAAEHPSAAGVRLFDDHGDAVGAVQAWAFTPEGEVAPGPIVLDLDDRLP